MMGESESARSWPQRHAPTLSWLVAAAVLAVAIPIASALLDGRAEWIRHGVGHALPALAIASVAAAAALRWPPARRVAPGPAARRFVVVGLWGMAAGQLLEVIGARVDEPSATAVETVAHTAGQIATMLSALVLLAGGLLSAAAAVRDRALPVWAAALLGAAAIGLLALMFIGVPGG